MEFCRNSQCPFKDCADHPSHAPFGFAYTAVAKDEECDRLRVFREAEAAKQDRMRRMTLGDAYIIFQNIESPDISDEEKGLAIWKIASMPTQNGVKKDDMVKVIRYLLDLCFEVPDYVK